MNGLILADFIADRTSAGADRAADECAFAAADESAYGSASRSGAANDFQAGVMTMIVRGLSGLCSPVSALSESSEWNSERKCERKDESVPVEFHRANPLPG